MVEKAGNPSFSQEKIAFSVGTTVKILDYSLQQIGEVQLSHYANTIALSPDGNYIVYNDGNDKLWKMELNSSSPSCITLQRGGFYGPQWSPDGSMILLRSIGGECFLVNSNTNAQISLGKLVNPQWNQNNEIIATRLNIVDEKLRGIEIVRSDCSGKSESIISNDSVLPVSPTVSPDRRFVVFSSQKKFYMVDTLSRGSLQELKISQPRQSLKCEKISIARNASRSSDIKIIHGVPYLHQLWSTNFPKAVACGATSAVMVLAYYEKLKKWDFISTYPFKHTSHYGNYVRKKYTWGGYTFNKLGSGSSYATYGAHGYIWHEPVNTKVHMKEYFELHGLNSSVDWSPTWDELKENINASHPFVILTSITHAGHYKTVVGYHKNQHTVIVNDPYGNKNERYGKFNGAAVSYDWPGYNNGYQNLNTVHCYIYAKGNVPSKKLMTTDKPIIISGFPYTNNNTTCTSNGSDVFDKYSTSKANEKGREITYKFTVNKPGTLTVSVTCDNAVDVDIHLLNKLSANACLIRNDKTFTKHIAAGTYYIICDTFVSGENELMGDYTLKCQFKAD